MTHKPWISSVSQITSIVGLLVLSLHPNSAIIFCSDLNSIIHLELINSLKLKLPRRLQDQVCRISNEAFTHIYTRGISCSNIVPSKMVNSFTTGQFSHTNGSLPNLFKARLWSDIGGLKTDNHGEENSRRTLRFSAPLGSYCSMVIYFLRIYHYEYLHFNNEEK